MYNCLYYQYDKLIFLQTNEFLNSISKIIYSHHFNLFTFQKINFIHLFCPIQYKIDKINNDVSLFI